MDPTFQPLEKHEDPRGNGIGVAVSLIAHFGFLVFLWVRYTEPVTAPQQPLRYVHLISQQPRTFTEAPGPKTETAPPDAPFSDANRHARTPSPSGDRPSRRPGPADAPFIPGTAGGSPAAPPQNQPGTAPTPPRSDFHYRVGETAEAAITPGPIDWRSAIKEVGKVASLGGELGVAGGEPGFAESGPVSFETQWYEWGDYAKLMVARIRHHWYANMPGIVRLGLAGVVTIRFTIQRSGAVTDVQVVSSSGIPPFDFAAKKAIELSSPFAPLPEDFPNSSERVTAAFYYNQRPPR